MLRVGVVVCGVLVVAVLAVLGFSRNEDIVPLLPPILRNDKTLHFAGFLLLSLVVFFAWDLPSLRKTLALSVVLMVLASVMSEVLQGLLPYRTFDAKDIEANLTGSAVGLGVAVCLQTVWTSRVVKRLRQQACRFPRLPYAATAASVAYDRVRQQDDHPSVFIELPDLDVLERTALHQHFSAR
ncbi:hypothetical protein BC831DRAFT_512464 [Entophlyctis helioformis]|nr:hypothetical protein BC831DRAFT_512464 [Entophlyctis helioformis]